jgi:excisionase family DNA binding protein
VKAVASLLDCHENQVRELIATGELSAHRIGERGIRIFSESLAEYRARHQIAPTKDPESRAAQAAYSRESATRHKAAMANLREWGLIK